MTLLSLVEGLAAAEIKVVLVGGLAVRAHGVNRVTDDVDVCYETGYFNERTLVKLLRSWQGYPRDALPGLPYRLSRTHLREHDTVRLRTVHGYLDLMREVPGVGPYREVIAQADTMRLASGLVLPLINLEKLIRAKETADRAKDREVLLELKALRASKRFRELGLPEADEQERPASPPDSSEGEPPSEGPPATRRRGKR